MPNPPVAPAFDATLAFRQSSHPAIVLAPDRPRWTIMEVNDAYLRVTHRRREDLMGQGLLDVFPQSAETAAQAGAHNVRHALDEVLTTRAPVRHPAQRYDLPSESAPGGFEEHYWDMSTRAILSDDGAVVALIHEVESATGRVMADRERERLLQELERERARLSQVFQRAPSFIVAFRGDDHTYEFVNEAYYQLVGHRPLIGKPLFEALPEMRDQGFAELLTRVRESGIPWVGRETPAQLQRTPGAPMETRFLDMVFQALTEGDGSRTGVVAHGSDVTSHVLARREVERLLQESELANRRLQDNAAELEAKSDELRRTAEQLKERTDEAERARRAAEQAERQLQMTFMQAPAAVAVTVGAEHRFVLANAAYAELVGRSIHAGDTFREALPEIAAQGYAALLDEALATGRPHAGEESRAMVSRRGGPPEEGWYDFVYQPLIDGDGAVTGVMQLAVDVTGRVRARRDRDELLAVAERSRGEIEALAERLRASEARFRDAFEQGPAAIAVLEGPDQVYTLVSPMYERYVARGPLLGRSVREAIPGVDDTVFGRAQRSVFENGEPLSLREAPSSMDRDGDGVAENYLFDVHYAPMRDDTGAVYAVATMVVDVTSAVNVRRQLEEARSQAEAANRAKSEFLAVMSHELRTPLNAIGGYAELIELGVRGPVTPEQTADLARIQRSQRHLLGLINGVLNYARLEAGQAHYELSDVWVDEVLSTCESLVAPQVRTRGLAMRDDGGPRGLKVRADGDKVQQIVLNLLSNAMKFTRAGTISIGRAADGDRVAITVTDTGLGIAADQLERIFHPFVQVDAQLTRVQDGTGLGLAISRDLARGMGGDLSVTSRLGEGSVFRLTLPAVAIGDD